MRTSRRRLGSVLATAVLLLSPARAGAHLAAAAAPVAPSTTVPATPTRPQLSLLHQLTSQDRRSFTIDVAVDGLSATAASPQIVATLHQRAKTREAFALNVGSGSLGSALAIADSDPLDATEAAAGTATRRLTFQLGDRTAACPTCVTLSVAGVYPVHVELRTGDSETVIDQFTTFLVWQPAGRTPMAVALIVPIHLPTRSPGAPPADTAPVITLIEALASRPSTPLTVLPTPETLDALSPSSDPNADPGSGPSGPLIDELRSALAGREVLASTYVRWDPALADDDRLTTLLAQQYQLGRSVVESRLGVTAVDDIAIVGHRVPSDRVLDRLGIRRLVAISAALVPSETPLDPSQPFVVDPGARSGRETQARATVLLDDRLQSRLVDSRRGRPAGTDDVLHAHQVLAELGMIALAGSSATARGVALEVPDTTSQATLAELLDGLDAEPDVLRPTTLSSLYGLPLHTERDGSTTFRIPVASPTPSAAATRTTTRLVTSLLHAAAGVRGYRSLFGLSATAASTTSTASRTTASSTINNNNNTINNNNTLATATTTARENELDGLTRRLGQLTATELTTAQRTSALASFDTQLAQRLGRVTLPRAKRVTLTARRQKIPVSVVNDTGAPVQLTMIVETDNIELLDGSTDPRVPARETLRRNIRLDGRVHLEDVAVATRGPGSFSMIVRLRTPDGYEFSSVRYTLRSTAIGPIGKILTFGSLLVLAIWWGRTILATRRRRAILRHPCSTSPEEPTE